MSKLVKSVSAEERKFLRKAFWRSATLYAAVSPAKQGASGFCYSLMPALNHFYKDPEKKKEALSRSMSYFNTTVPFSTFIMGLVASMEKENSEKPDFDTASINAVKSSLMGPLAGQSGNVLAPLVFLILFNLPSILVRYYGTFLGYKLGSQYIQKVYASGLMNILTKAASTVGLIMVGGMTAQMVTFTSKLEVSMKGESVMNLQNMLDQIFVGIVPLGITLLCYYLLKKKNVSITVLILGVIVLSIVLSVLGIA